MLIMLLCAHDMTKHVCEISHLNSKRLLRKLQKMLGGYFILPHPVHRSALGCSKNSYSSHIHSLNSGYAYAGKPGMQVSLICRLTAAASAIQYITSYRPNLNLIIDCGQMRTRLSFNNQLLNYV